MLIDSSELHAKLYVLTREIRDSRMLFSDYKIAIEVVQKMHDIIDALEADKKDD